MEIVKVLLWLVFAYLIPYSIGYIHGKKDSVIEVHCSKTDCEHWDTCKLKSLCGKK